MLRLYSVRTVKAQKLSQHQYDKKTGLPKTHCTKDQAMAWNCPLFVVLRMTISDVNARFQYILLKTKQLFNFVSVKAVLEQHKGIKTDICSTAHTSWRFAEFCVSK